MQKNQNRKTFRKAINLALLALSLIIWSCTTTEIVYIFRDDGNTSNTNDGTGGNTSNTNDGTGGNTSNTNDGTGGNTSNTNNSVERIVLYENLVPLIYTGIDATGEPNRNLLLSGFVKHPADGRLLDFVVDSNPYGITVDDTSDDPFQYSMLRVGDGSFTNASDVAINVSVIAKDGSGTNNLTITTDRQLIGSEILHFAGLSRRMVADGCEIKAGAAAGNSFHSTFSFNWFARFRPGPGVYNSSTTNIDLAIAGLNGRGNVGLIFRANLFNDLTNDSTIHLSSPVTASPYYSLGNYPLSSSTRAFPWYSEVTFTVPRPDHPNFANSSNPYNANVRNGVPISLFAGTVVSETTSNNFIDYQCNVAE